LGAHRSILLTIRELPESMRPAAVERYDSVTVVAWHRGAMRVEVGERMVDLLKPHELDAIRAGYGHPPVGQPCPEWITYDEPIVHWVPAALRVKGEPAVQGLELSMVEALEYEAWAASLIVFDLQESA
jgi:hypothetical protein